MMKIRDVRTGPRREEKCARIFKGIAPDRCADFQAELKASCHALARLCRPCFAVAYTAEHDADASYHIVVISNLGTESIEIRIRKADRPNGSPYATLAPGASASFVTPNSLFVRCAAKACRAPVDVNYLEAF